MLRGTVLFGLVTLVLPLVANPGIAQVKTREMSFESGHVPFRQTVKAFVAEPAGKGPFPAILMIHDSWGLTDWMKDNARRLAAKGYVVLAPDLFQGKVAGNPDQAKKLKQELSLERGLQHTMNGVNQLAEMKNVNKDKLGIIGWGHGGYLALQLSRVDSRLQACVMCYGNPTTDARRFKLMQTAVLGIFAENDSEVPPARVREFGTGFKAAGKKIEGVHFLKGTGHGFMRPTQGAGKKNPDYNEEKAKEAWKMIDDFFGKNLGGK